MSDSAIEPIFVNSADESYDVALPVYSIEKVLSEKYTRMLLTQVLSRRKQIKKEETLEKAVVQYYINSSKLSRLRQRLSDANRLNSTEFCG